MKNFIFSTETGIGEMFFSVCAASEQEARQKITDNPKKYFCELYATDWHRIFELFLSVDKLKLETEQNWKDIK